MATPYGAQGGGAATQQAPSMQQWYDQQHNNGSGELRSVTPAMNNTRGAFRHDASPPYGHPGVGGAEGQGNFSHGPGGTGVNTGGEIHYERAPTPNRYLGAYNSPDQGDFGANNSGAPGLGGSASKQQQVPADVPTPSSSGLIRLSLRKPMGIVFEPMYDPNNPSLQRGVRICDLPRTGAAALSRKLEVGDELLSINDKTMSRLTFDEIMDFIIEADPEEVHLLFRRPRKEALQARQGIKKPSTQNTSQVKWVDDDVRHKKKDSKKKDRKPEKKSSRKKEEDDTITSADDDYRGRSRKKNRSRKHPYESESFLDLLIDTICANPDMACRERRRNDDDYYSDEDEEGTFASQDDSTYVTYESEEQVKRRSKGHNHDNRDQKHRDRDNHNHNHNHSHNHTSSKKRDDSSADEETEEDTVEEKWKRRRSREKEAARNKSPVKEAKRAKTPEKEKNEGKYEDDGTLETEESAERVKPVPIQPEVQEPPLGLTPNPEPEPINLVMPPPADTDDDGNPAPIKEVEYDERFDHGADVSVMESLGGPSLLIEKQRQAAVKTSPASPSAPPVPPQIIENFGNDYPVTFGLTHEQSIQADPLKFYTHVVKGLLEEHEPEKVRLLDKLLAKYKGREDHLVQKLSVRYNKPAEEAPQPVNVPEEEEPVEDEGQEHAFTEAVTENKNSPVAAAAVDTARQMIQENTEPPDFPTQEWPEKETKEAEEGDSGDEPSHSGSDFSAESIDGTSPAVIAQVSELLNYVYGKTSVPGQIDRVSTIMRAYEGREAVLLELLETKALIKANKEKENTENLPSFLRNSQAMQYMNTEEVAGASDMPPVTPMATATQQHGSGTVINDDISSMSGVSQPSPGEAQQQQQQPVSTNPIPIPVPEEEIEFAQSNYYQHSEMKGAVNENEAAPVEEEPSRNKSRGTASTTSAEKSDKKKKKGLFGGLFGGKKGKKQKEAASIYAAESLRSGSRSRNSGSRKTLKNARSAEVSI